MSVICAAATDVTYDRRLRQELSAGPEEGSESAPYLVCVAARQPRSVYDRVLERRRAVVLAHHFREFEGLSIAHIADRLGR